MLFLHFRHERFFRGRTPALEKINLNGRHILAGCGESLRMRTGDDYASYAGAIFCRGCVATCLTQHY
jgi:hypothetical protein